MIPEHRVGIKYRALQVVTQEPYHPAKTKQNPIRQTQRSFLFTYSSSSALSMCLIVLNLTVFRPNLWLCAWRELLAVTWGSYMMQKNLGWPYVRQVLYPCPMSRSGLCWATFHSHFGGTLVCRGVYSQALRKHMTIWKLVEICFSIGPYVDV